MDVLAPLAIGDRRSPEVPTPNIEVFLKCGVAPIGVKQHIFGATVFVCVCVWVLHDWETENNYCEHTWRTNFGHKIIIGRLGWPRLVLSTTLLELLYSGVWV